MRHAIAMQLADADAHLGRRVPLPAAALGLVRWSEIEAVGSGGVEIDWALDDSRSGAPGRLALYAGHVAAPAQELPGDVIERDVRVGEASARWREADLAEAQASLRPVVECSWAAYGLHLRLTAQGAWLPDLLLTIAASVG